jgi:phosphate transport system permease protein
MRSSDTRGVTISVRSRLRSAAGGILAPQRAGVVNWSDRLVYNATRLLALFVILLAVLLVISLFQGSWEAIQEFGFGFITGSTWNPVTQEFSTLPTIVATIFKAIIALVIAVPISIGSAVYLALYMPAWLRNPVSYLVETLAAIPSVIIGLWGLFIMVPRVRVFQEWLHEHFWWFPFFTPGLREFREDWIPWFPLIFDGPAYLGVGILSGGLILAIMIIPIITAISRDLIRAVPRTQMEGMLALGATKWEAVWKTVLPYTRVGLVGAVGLGLGRAVGETMAVTMVGGNAFRLPTSLFDPVHSMASKIASEFLEATYSLYLSSLIYVGLVLFGITIIINLLAQLLVWHMSRGHRGAGMQE